MKKSRDREHQTKEINIFEHIRPVTVGEMVKIARRGKNDITIESLIKEVEYHLSMVRRGQGGIYGLEEARKWLDNAIEMKAIKMKESSNPMGEVKVMCDCVERSFDEYSLDVMMLESTVDDVLKKAKVPAKKRKELLNDHSLDPRDIRQMIKEMEKMI